MKKAYIEAFKELGRVVLLSIIPVLISQMDEKMFNWEVVIITGSIAVLRFLDKLLHEMGKESNNDKAKKGLTGF